MDTIKEPAKQIKKKGIKEFSCKYYDYLLSFFIPFVFILISFAIAGIYPVGDRQIMNYDGWHQYYPFVMRLWDNVRSGNLFYDWSLGMGTNFISLVSYYAASPLNLFILLSPVRDTRVIYTFLVVLRIGLSGLFSYTLLKKTAKKGGIIAVSLSSVYALSGYVTGYYWNVMWLDGVMLLPLIVLGVYYLYKEKRGALYTVSLALTLFSNYYIGYMCCIFSVITFISIAISEKTKFVGVLKNFLRFALYSILAGGISMIILLPAFFGLTNTFSVNNTFPESIETYYPFSYIISGFSDLTTPTVLDGLPNVFVGCVAVFFANAFLWSKKAKLREKITALSVIAFLILSLNVNVLDFIWHGFHFTNMLPSRFAFIIPLVIVFVAYRYFCQCSDSVDYIDIIGMILFSMLITVCTWLSYKDMYVIVSVAVFCTMLVAVTFYANKIIPQKAFSLFVCAVILFEAGESAYLGVKAVGTTSYSEYFNSESNDEIRECVSYIEETEKESNEIARTEFSEWISLNDSAVFGYKGITQFSSAANVRTSEFLQKLGLSADAGSNRFAYVDTTPLTNTLIGIKYVISRSGFLPDTDMIRKKVDNTKNVALYEYSGYCGIGFGMDKKAADYEFSNVYLPYESQNELFSCAAGIDSDFLNFVGKTNEEFSNVACDKVSDTEYSYLILEEGDDTYAKFEYVAPESGMYYVYADVDEARYVLVNNAWHNISEFPNYFSAGFFNKDEKFILKVRLNDLPKDTEGKLEIAVTRLDEEVWLRGLEKFSESKFNVTSLENNIVEGYVDFEEEKYLYFSVPYESGWTMYVDGNKTEIQPFADSMCGVLIDSGHHTVKLEFVPKGFYAGCVISLVSLAGFVAALYVERKMKKNPNPIPEETSDKPILKDEKNDISEIDECNPKGN